MTLYEELKWRGLIKDVAGDDLEKLLNGKPITFYWGTDPTADSLHLGHYSSLVTAKRLAKAGHHPILLVGGATGLIGDPRPTAEREIISKEQLNKNLEGIKKQVSDIFDGKAEVVNNYDWFKGYEFTDFLRDVGKYININYMLDKDIIRRRLETGITFAEFAYTLIQGYDFLWLYQNKNCVLQAEGSDQWGNITTGIDLIRKKLGKEAYGFTMPLVLDKYGRKFGKSEGNALWLDRNKTSSYELYQYLINVDDEMVISYLKIFTFLSVEEINELEKSNKEHPELREAHKALARCIITDLHGKESYNEALNISEALFSGNIKNLTSKEIEMAFKGLDKLVIDKDMNIVDFLVEYNICSSKREAREFVNNNSISINGEKINSLDFTIDKSIAIDNKYVVVRRGKKKYFIACFGGKNEEE
ncbi:MAG TPA: tyrosine--tRNA ligase [Candidatus Onthousia faecipullorum]|uniref:Tyrosine--tRNA ligase n=1 Tax=Candidatus Onthousia faecipullorum TaxID=2840887 RepID=A0A9D1KCS1_9FIRM|nr:tyrosine--tRNA ligase [Candidatus Onthousia faecipullorum]